MINGQKTKLTCTMYSEDKENALMSALELCAKENGQHIYEYLEHTPKTSLVVELIQGLERFGYSIVKVQITNNAERQR